VENKYQLTRKVLKLLYEYRWPVHILTKSRLVERDFDLLEQINQQRQVIVSFSFSSMNDAISAIVEPHVPSPSERLKTLGFFKKRGIACGMFLLPVIPFISDTQELISKALQKANQIGVDFVIFGGMTLKDGRQKEYFYQFLKDRYPELLIKYKQIYGANNWGQATAKYYTKINQIFNEASRKYKIPRRIPPSLYRNILSENDLVIVMLEHLDYFLRLNGKPASFGYAAYSISQLKRPLSAMKNKLREINGVGEKTEKIILEILETKNSAHYNSLS
jgi:DNA repair photolyase